MKTMESTSVPATPDALIGAIRVAQSKGQQVVYATKDLVDYFTGKTTEPFFNMMGVFVCKEGHEKDMQSVLSKTMEQVNFGKI